MLGKKIEEKLITFQQKKLEQHTKFKLSEDNKIHKIYAITTMRAANITYYFLLLMVFIQDLFYSRSNTSVKDTLKMIWLIRSVKYYTAVFVPQLALLYKLSKEIETRSLPGDIVECGVFNGGSSALISSLCCKNSFMKRKLWLCDSFEGLPPPTIEDGEDASSYEGLCHGELSRVKEILRKLKIPESDINIVKGWFQDTFPSLEIKEIALLHIDADWYDSVKLCLEKFYDSVQPGGFIVLDDYAHWEGCTKATDEFIKEKAPGVKLIKVGYSGCYFQKPTEPSVV